MCGSGVCVVYAVYTVCVCALTFEHVLGASYFPKNCSPVFSRRSNFRPGQYIIISDVQKADSEKLDNLSEVMGTVSDRQH